MALQPGITVYTCNPYNWENETGGLWVRGPLGYIVSSRLAWGTESSLSQNPKILQCNKCWLVPRNKKNVMLYSEQEGCDVIQWTRRMWCSTVNKKDVVCCTNKMCVLTKCVNKITPYGYDGIAYSATIMISI